MSWWNDVFDWASSAASTVKDFAVANPGAAGAIASGLTGGFQGKYGENNFGNLAGGYALGTLAGGLANYGSGTSGMKAPTSADVSGASAPAATASDWTSAAPTSATTLPTVSQGATTGTWGGAGVQTASEMGQGFKDYMAGAGSTPSTGILDTASTSLKTLRESAKPYQDVIGLGMKGLSALAGMDAGRKADQMREDYANRSAAANAENAANVQKKNVLVDQQAADYQAIDPQRTAAKAYATTTGQLRGKADEYETRMLGKGYSPATAAAEKRRALLGASTSGVTAAESARTGAEATRRAGLQSIGYAKQDTPSYDASYINDIANGGQRSTAGAYGLLDDVLGRSKSKAEDQVGVQ